MTAAQAPDKQLELVKEVKIFDLLEQFKLDPRLEASGVLAKDGMFYVIFDNLPHIALIGAELSATAGANQVIEQHEGHPRGFEDIAYDPWSDRFYVLIESLLRPGKVHGHGAGVRRELALPRERVAGLPA